MFPVKGLKNANQILFSTNKILSAHSQIQIPINSYGKIANTSRILKTVPVTCVSPPGAAGIHLNNPLLNENGKNWSENGKNWSENQLTASQVAVSERVMLVKVDVKGFKRENVTVKVEGQWLIIEAFSSVVDSSESPSFTQRHVMRRFEIPPDTDLNNIKSTFDAEKNLLIVTIPRISPEIKVM